MPDPKLEAIVQRMIDANAPEESIGAVIHEYNYQNPDTRPKAVEGGPESYWAGALKGAEEGVVGGAKGFVKGVLPGVGSGIKGVAGSPIALLKEAIATIHGAGNLAADPEKTLNDAWEKVKGIPGQAHDIIQSAVELAATNPEDFGKLMGHLTGEAAVGIATAKALPMAPKPIARTVGKIAEQVGTKGAWPIRMMGAHQLGSGNPMGIATMMVPEGLKQGGKSLKQWGESEPALVQKQIAQFRGPKDVSLGPTTPTTVNATPPDVVDRALAESRGSTSAPTSGGLSTLDRKNLVKGGYTPEMIADIEKRAATPAPGGVRLTRPAPVPVTASEGEAPYTGARPLLDNPQSKAWANKEYKANHPIAVRIHGARAEESASVVPTAIAPKPDLVSRTLAKPPEQPFASIRSRIGAPDASAVNPITPEMQYRELSRKPVLTPEDAQMLAHLKQLVEKRASEVGMSYASGGKAGPAISPEEQ